MRPVHITCSARLECSAGCDSHSSDSPWLWRASRLCFAPAECTSDDVLDVSSPDAADAFCAHEVTRLAGAALFGTGGGVEAARSSSAC